MRIEQTVTQRGNDSMGMGKFICATLNRSSIVKNCCKNRDHNWMNVTISPRLDAGNNVIGYFTARRNQTLTKIAESEGGATVLDRRRQRRVRKAFPRKQVMELQAKPPIRRISPERTWPVYC